jgi:hypothetical protein
MLMTLQNGYELLMCYRSISVFSAPNNFPESSYERPCHTTNCTQFFLFSIDDLCTM